MNNTDLNPIRSVNGASIRTPSSYVYKLEDVSASDSGRTEDMLMHKKRVGQLVGLDLSWKNITTAECCSLLKAFDPEYITVEYLDVMQGEYITSEFFVGGRSAPMYSAAKGLWSDLSFSITERSGV